MYIFKVGDKVKIKPSYFYYSHEFYPKDKIYVVRGYRFGGENFTTFQKYMTKDYYIVKTNANLDKNRVWNQVPSIYLELVKGEKLKFKDILGK